MKFLKFTRYAEWWEYKLVPLVSIGYATLLFENHALNQALPRLLFILCSIIIGAVYVSVINDVTDISEDAAAGKNNRMASAKPLTRTIIIGTCLLAGIVFGYFIYPDLTGLFFYAMAWLVFSLYSVPPVRLKKRGIWGVFCDAMGAHFFPTMLIAANLTYYAHANVNSLWYTAVGLWSFCYGLRGILWHQFYDRENDLRSGTTTFASRILPENFKVQERLIFTLEILSLAIILFYIMNIWIFVFIVLYVILTVIRRLSFGYQLCLIIAPASAPYQLVMNDYYLVLFPLSILFTAAMNYKYAWIVLCCHFLLFPRKTILILKDMVLFTKNSVFKIK